MSFQSLGLNNQLVENVSSLGFEQPTPVQLQAIPEILAGHDVLAGAQTGTGKTAAFGLPLIHRLLESGTAVEAKQVKALILTPTRELAQQVFDSLSVYAKNTPLKVAVAYGGTSMKVQVKALESGVDILVATPGRLLDHAHVRTVDLRKSSYLVLDEADRMLDMGFIDDIKRILKRMQVERQTSFFSATFGKQVKKLAFDILDDPKLIEVTPSNSTAVTVEQMVYPVDKHRKSELLAYLIGSRNWQQVLVFTKTKQGSDELAKELGKDGIKAVSINGDKSQGARQRALEDFKSGKARVLVATDVAARGLDIEQLEYVINYEMPFKAEDYVHRIGRTGRAGQTGHAISLMSLDEEWALRAIEELLDTRLPQQWLEGYEPDPTIEPPENRRRGRSSDKRRAKAKSHIHKNRGRHSARK
ncbi:DEAD/DEAH box helicase [Photobacterium lutimaris]|uniref:DEAD-box ATP-dependent RNA helicase RhpA n=1 Tax=Photobacterium lutimaris TaxID=388278 RepID=A0A2T3J0A1_9GAMM|nr:DEAD/DEAH box helicase [Photobacterium lutimaris]PSU34379.1 DEAD/DEAH box helicase [Photobacterium lutimaris]TDR75980.1 ATP-dependent RNA helicase RhlE [Photobacterium lutimaris]